MSREIHAAASKKASKRRFLTSAAVARFHHQQKQNEQNAPFSVLGAPNVNEDAMLFGLKNRNDTRALELRLERLETRKPMKEALKPA